MSIRPTHPFLALATVIALLGLAGCSSAPTVRADYDRSADFTAYRTFGFASPLGTDREGYQSVVSLHLKQATQREMEARGMQRVDSAPQLLINFNASLSDKLRVTSAPVSTLGTGYYGYYGYRRGLYAPWPMYVEQTSVTQYQEGTLNIDVVDAARKQLVWEGVVSNTVTAKMLDNVQAAIDEAVAAAFAKYPLPAPAPVK